MSIPEATDREPISLIVAAPDFTAIAGPQEAGPGIARTGLRTTPPITVANNGEEHTTDEAAAARKT